MIPVSLSLVSSKPVINDLLVELFEKEGKGWFRVVSGSMTPLIEVNDRVLVRKENIKQIGVGDIILFKEQGVLVVHRVLGKFCENGRLYFLQRGDCGGSVGRIAAENVMGKVVAVEKKGRVLRLQGWKKIVNTLLGINNYASYHLGVRVDAIKATLRDKPGFQCLRLSYRILKKPFIFLNRGIVRLLMAGVWIGTRWEAKGEKLKAKGEK